MLGDVPEDAPGELQVRKHYKCGKYRNIKTCDCVDDSATTVRPGVAPPGVEVPAPTGRGRGVSQERPGPPSSQPTAPPSATSGGKTLD